MEALGAGIGARAWMRRAAGSAVYWSSVLGRGWPGQSVREGSGCGDRGARMGEARTYRNS
jgi:hypothetical protein